RVAGLSLSTCLGLEEGVNEQMIDASPRAPLNLIGQGQGDDLPPGTFGQLFFQPLSSGNCDCWRLVFWLQMGAPVMGLTRSRRAIEDLVYRFGYGDGLLTWCWLPGLNQLYGKELGPQGGNQLCRPRFDFSPRTLGCPSLFVSGTRL